MNLRVFSYHFFLFSLWFCLINNSISQTNNTIKFSDKLDQLEQEFEISFSYNHTFFDTVFLNQNTDCNTIADCINMIEKMVPVKFTNNSTTNYVLLPVRKDITFEVIDNDTNENISSLEYQINQESVQFLTAEENIFTLKEIFLLDSIHIINYSYNTIHIKAKDLVKSQKLNLTKKQFQLNEIILSGYLTKGIDANVSDHSLQINTESLGLLAGETDGDIFNVINNIPGIHSPSGKSGNLNFRGNTYDQNLVQIDDIPIYHSGHFLGAISPYNTSVVTNVEVQRNMLPVKFGGRVGGLIDMTTSDKIPNSTQYGIAVNTLFAGATIKAKLIPDKLSFSAAFRTSYPNFKTPKLEAISTLIFQGSRLESISDEINTSSNFTFDFLDMNAKLNYKINDRHTASLSFINIQNNLSAKIDNTGNNNQTDFRDLELDNWGITGKWKAVFSEKLTTELRVSKSNMNLVSLSEGFVLEERSNREKFDNVISDTRLITEVIYDYSTNTSFEAGYTLTEHKLISNEIEEQNGIDSERKQDAIVHSSYISFQKNWNDKLNINFGFHNNYYAPLKKFYANPRLLASYSINNKLYLKSSLGTSNQFIQKKLNNDFDDFNITNQLWFLPNDDIATQKGIQTMLGGVLNKSKWLIDLELYYKKTNNITNKSSDVHGNISSVGANIFVKKRWHRLETWISYAVSKTETDFNNKKTDAFFDQRHVINLTSLLNLNKWKFAISWGYFSGMPVIFSDETDSGNTPDPISSDRFDALHQLDFSSSYTFYNPSKSVKTVIGLSILNVYNQDNTVNVFQNTTENTFRKASNFSPNLQINLFF
ncbi:TonB-dependent Receptor Plug Domain [Aquimarina amphilecti]|uniref:TonB-dependent Receptor Plug Domain n=1 Tax=Aquimarina amphilecti TaxID=1038014 RepID=A0A1H7HI16_AQUAM|nr:TonB-dependent receptor plug domain-containing protein [Aquimarina amphilecti]SEK48570.1 TonB-dependent Receptor Plug Domain [Aquimarina amphilecti]